MFRDVLYVTKDLTFRYSKLYNTRGIQALLTRAPEKWGGTATTSYIIYVLMFFPLDSLCPSLSNYHYSV